MSSSSTSSCNAIDPSSIAVSRIVGPASDGVEKASEPGPTGSLDTLRAGYANAFQYFERDRRRPALVGADARAREGDTLCAGSGSSPRRPTRRPRLRPRLPSQHPNALTHARRTTPPPLQKLQPASAAAAPAEAAAAARRSPPSPYRRTVPSPPPPLRRRPRRPPPRAAAAPAAAAPPSAAPRAGTSPR